MSQLSACQRPANLTSARKPTREPETGHSQPFPSDCSARAAVAAPRRGAPQLAVPVRQGEAHRLGGAPARQADGALSNAAMSDGPSLSISRKADWSAATAPGAVRFISGPSSRRI